MNNFHDSSRSNEEESPNEYAKKRPPSSYILFARNRRSELIEENPEFKASEIRKIIADEWKILPEEDKEYYIRLHAKLLNEYKKSHLKSSKKCKHHSTFIQNLHQLKGSTLYQKYNSMDDLFLPIEEHKKRRSKAKQVFPSPCQFVFY